MTRHIRFDTKFIMASQNTPESWAENIPNSNSRSFHLDGLDSRSKITEVARSDVTRYRYFHARCFLSGHAINLTIRSSSAFRNRNSERHVALVNCVNLCLSKDVIEMRGERNAVLACSSNKLLTLEAYVRAKWLL